MGLLLAVALRQNQTTGRWPAGIIFADLMSEPEPEHWFPAYWWNTVKALIADEAGRTHVHQASAAASLDHSDWPELAAELRRYRFVRTSPELAALSGTTLPG